MSSIPLSETSSDQTVGSSSRRILDEEPNLKSKFGEDSIEPLATRNAAAGTGAGLIQAVETTSHFLELPTEIRLEIYQHIIPNTLVHVGADWIDPSGDSGIRAFAHECKLRIRLESCHHPCDVETWLYEYLMGNASEEPPEKRLGDLSAICDPEYRRFPLWKNGMHFRGRHYYCLSAKKRRSKVWDLRFLQTCKTIYEEAKFLHFRKTTFAFRAPDTFDTFMFQRSSLELSNIRSLHLDISPEHEMEEWGYALEPEALKSLSALSKLSLWIDFVSNKDDDKRSKDYMETFDAEVYYKRSFCFFRMLPLKRVEVMLNPGTWPHQPLPGHHFSWEEIRKWAKDFENRLLTDWTGPMDLLDA